MSEFLAICEYFAITPVEFFNNDGETILIQKELVNEISGMNSKDLELLTQLARRLNNSENQ